MRQELHLSIPNGSSSSVSSTPSTAGTEYALCSVLCFYDFASEDADHLPFRKNEILDVVQQEETGWWAAMRRGGDTIGWIPQAFVKVLSDDMAESLWNVREDLRVYEYEAEQLYNTAPIRKANPLYDSPSPSPSPVSPVPPPPPGKNRISYDTYFQPDPPRSARLQPPPSPATPMPHPPHDWEKQHAQNDHVRSRSESAAPFQNGRRRRDPVLVDSEVDLARLSRLIEKPTFSAAEKRGRPDKVRQLTGEDDAIMFHQAQTGVSLHSPLGYSEHLQIVNDQIHWATVNDLVLRLTHDPLAKDPLKLAQDSQFQRTFLMTFRTFMTADQLFDMLVDRFRMDIPPELPDDDLDEWKDKVLLSTQRRVLTLFTMWLEDHRLLEEEPHIAQRLTDFLNLVVSPGLSALAKLIIQTIERLTFASPRDSSPINSPRKRRKSKAHKGELLKLDAIDIAEQLSLMEHKLYSKITPQECLAHSKSKPGKNTSNLTQFCATYDQLAAWVKMSVLNNEALSKRADTVDFWIKVAEKCRNLNNFASMSAVINALSSSDVTRLHLTWAHINRKSNLDGLLKYNEPTGGWAGYRSLITSAEGNCVPFIGMYLTDLVHIADQFSDAPLPDDQGIKVCFLQRIRWAEVITTMLRSQTRPYAFVEGGGSTLNFILANLKIARMKDRQWFYARSQEVQQSELANADIRKGLEAAGF